jgi:hypothetical protein
MAGAGTGSGAAWARALPPQAKAQIATLQRSISLDIFMPSSPKAKKKRPAGPLKAISPDVFVQTVPSSYSAAGGPLEPSRDVVAPRVVHRRRRPARRGNRKTALCRTATGEWVYLHSDEARLWPCLPGFRAFARCF